MNKKIAVIVAIIWALVAFGINVEGKDFIMALAVSAASVAMYVVIYVVVKKSRKWSFKRKVGVFLSAAVLTILTAFTPIYLLVIPFKAIWLLIS